jgi:chitodextrinase
MQLWRHRYRVAIVLFVACLSGSLHAQVSQCPFKIDAATAQSVAQRDGLLFTRYGLGLRGPSLVAGTGFTAAAAPNIESFMQSNFARIDVDGSGTIDSVDGVAISRVLSGYSTAVSSTVVPAPTAVRSSTTAIQQFLDAGCPSPAPDSIAPSTPTNLRVTNRLVNAVSVAWNASTDNIAVVGYELFRDNVAVGTTPTTSFNYTGLTTPMGYELGVRAFDAWGNKSAVTTIVGVPSTAAVVAQLKSMFTKLVYVDTDNVFADTARTAPAIDGVNHPSLTLTELIDGTHVTWTEESPRKSLLSTAYGFGHDRRGPTFKNPAGDVPHVFIPNVIASQFASTGTFATQNSPNTSAVLFRNRRAVSYEGGLGIGVFARDRDYNHYELGNFTGAVELPAGSGVAAFDTWSLLVLEDNGSSSRIYLNGQKLCCDVTLPTSFVNRLYYSTVSHALEHDVKFAGHYHGIFTAAQRDTLLALANQIVPIDSMPNAPVAFNPTISFDGIDTFSVPNYSFHSVGGVAIDPSTVEIDWFVVSTNIPTVQGWLGLDGQRFLHRGPTLKRSLFPSSIPAPGNGGQSVAVTIKARDLNGRGWTGIPFRSQFTFDNILGTPDGVYAPVLQSIVATAANTQRLTLTWTGGAPLNTGSGNASDFTVLVNGVARSVTAMSFAGDRVLQLTLASPLAHADVIIVKYRQGANPLKDTNSKVLENFISGMLVAVDNQIP